MGSDDSCVILVSCGCARRWRICRYFELAFAGASKPAGAAAQDDLMNFPLLIAELERQVRELAIIEEA